MQIIERQTVKSLAFFYANSHTAKPLTAKHFL